MGPSYTTGIPFAKDSCSIASTFGCRTATHAGNLASPIMVSALDGVLLHLTALFTARHAYGKGSVCC